METCTNDYNHEYATKECSNCHTIFCWSCCGATNVHEGGKYEPDYMACPNCGHDIYENE